ncbi:vespryn-21-like [Gopherus flavomarginatus]|uniref:vespryn-21-like n=1 Tax=Gopherus flavomarginatus TaxID=286002 RepID=UPI0021CBCF83|nr:vespryn-21-like [Gopherus flavomarginatus]
MITAMGPYKRWSEGKFQAAKTLSPDPKVIRGAFPQRSELLEKFKADVILDPDTANPWLIVSADGKSVRSGEKPQDDLPENPNRSDLAPCVVGSQGFTSGRHYWEVEFGDQREWAMGVARESVKRKEWLTLSPKDGIWSQGRWRLRREAFGSSETPQPHSGRPGKIGVCLGYEGAWVAFYEDDHTTMMLGSFNGEKFFPFFCLGRGVHLTLIP